eukprot:GEMP01014916.1.p1 GENE.GEMP01014916.1~~GEMP01014916.1.p1  ORF type:complete len:724 (-),score=127.36 GEMP01014916.1:675-2846(-)
MTCNGYLGYEPRNLDLTFLAKAKYGRAWKDLSVPEQVDILRSNLRAPWFLLDPESSYFMYWHGIVLVALCFTAIVTPYEVAFMTQTMWDTLFILNRIVDAIFAKDMCMHFFMKVKVPSKLPRQYVWITRHRDITWKYLKSWFIIDFLSAFPFYAFSTFCEDHDPELAAESQPHMGEKLLKLVRILETSRLADLARTRIQVKNVWFGLGRFLGLLALVSHWMACLWGFIGLVLGTNLRYPCKKEAVEWRNYGTEGSSWITVYFLNTNPYTPDSPCSHAHLYAVSLHWSLMTITSTGYGDVVPTRFAEFVVEIALMAMGSMVWAYIIGSASGLMANLDPYSVQYEQTMDELNYMMNDRQLDTGLKCRIREYFYQSRHLQRAVKYSDLMAQMSPALRGEISVLQGVFGSFKCLFFSSLSSELIVLISQRLIHRLYTPNETVTGIALYIVQRGLAARNGKVVTPGSGWGEDFILDAQHLIDASPAVALTYMEAVILTRSILDPLVTSFPTDAKNLRRAVVRLALIRGVPRLAAVIRKQKEQLATMEAREVASGCVEKSNGKETEQELTSRYSTATTAPTAPRASPSKRVNPPGRSVALAGAQMHSTRRTQAKAFGGQMEGVFVFDELKNGNDVAGAGREHGRHSDMKQLFSVGPNRDVCLQPLNPEVFPSPDFLRIENTLKSLIETVADLRQGQNQIMSAFGVDSNPSTLEEIATTDNHSGKTTAQL